MLSVGAFADTVQPDDAAGSVSELTDDISEETDSEATDGSDTADENEDTEEEESNDGSGADLSAVGEALKVRSEAAFENAGLDPVFLELTDEELEYLRQRDEGFERISDADFEGDGDESNANSVYTSDFFYDQLSAAEKDFYDELYRVALYIQRSTADFTGTPNRYAYFDTSKITLERAKKICTIFYYDHPEFFFYKNGWTWSNGVMACALSSDFYTYAARKAAKDEIDSITASWMNDIYLGNAETLRQQTIYTKIIENTVYDDTLVAANNQNLVGCLINHDCVCNGYALTNQYFCNQAGIECVTVRSDDHAWNIVNLYGKWYNIDVTWMDQGGYIWKDWLNRSTSSYMSMRYSESHTPYSSLYDGEFVLPVCDSDTVGAAPSASGLRDITVTQPAKLSYAPGEALDLSDMELRLDYEDYKSEYIPVTEDMISGYNPYIPDTYEVKVEYGGLETSFDVDVGAGLYIKKVAVDKSSLKTIYDQDEELDITGGKLVITYSDNSTLLVDITSDMVTNFDTATGGTKHINVEFGGYSAAYDIQVNTVFIESIEINGAHKYAFYLYDKLDIIGMTLKVKYSDGSFAYPTITEGMVSGFDNTRVGTQKITVSFEDGEYSYNVTVTKHEIDSWNILGTHKTEFYTGEEIDIIGKTLHILYKDGLSEDVTIEEDMVSGYNKDKTGIQTVHIAYKNSDFSYDVTVSAVVLIQSKVLNKYGLEPKTEYLEGETLDILGGTVTLKFNNGTEISKTINTSMVSGFDSTDPEKFGTQTVVINVDGTKVEYSVTVSKLTVEDIELPDHKDKLYTGDDLDIIGKELKVTYSNESVKYVPITKAMVEGFDKVTPGNQTIYVTYEGKTVHYNLTMIKLSVIKLTILGSYKTEYFIGETLDIIGKQMRVEYNSGKTEFVTVIDSYISGFDRFSTGSQTVVVSYNGGSTSYGVVVKQESVIEATIDYSYSTIYYTGEKLDILGEDLLVKYDSGRTETVVITSDMVSGFNTAEPGTQTVKVTYKGFVVSYVISMIELKITNLTFPFTPKKELYTGQELDILGATLTAHYNNGKTESAVVTYDMISGYNKEQEGEQTVTVTYKGFKQSYKVNVTKLAVKSLSVKEGYKTEYFFGEDLDVIGKTLVVIYNSGELEEVTITNSLISSMAPGSDTFKPGFDSTKTGTHTVRITYEGKNFTFGVTVSEVAIEKIYIDYQYKKDFFVGDKPDILGQDLVIKYNNGDVHKHEITKSMIDGFDTTTAGQNKKVTVGTAPEAFVYYINVKDIVVTAISIAEAPKTEYYQEDELDVTDGKLLVNYNNGKSEYVTLTADMVSNFDTTYAGTRKLVITYGGKQSELVITIKALEIEYLTVSVFPQTEYYTGDELSVEGGWLTAHYNNNKDKLIKMTKEMVSGFNTKRAGTQTLTVRYMNAVTQYNVKLSQLIVQSISIAKNPKEVYFLGEKLDLSDGLIYVLTNEPSRSGNLPMDNENVTVTGFDSTKTGIKELTLSYGGKTVKFKVTVAVDPSKAPIVVNGIGYLNLTDALKSIKAKESYIIEINSDVNVSTVTIPAAVSVTLRTNGAVLITNTLTSNADLIIEGTVITGKSGTGTNIKANRNLVIAAENFYGTITGTKNYNLSVNANCTATNISTFNNAAVVEPYILTVTGAAKGIDTLSGTWALPMGKAANAITANNVTKAKFLLTVLEFSSSTGMFVIPKVTVTNVSEGIEIVIIDAGGALLKIPEKQPVMYAGGTKNFAKLIHITNRTIEHAANIGAFLYGKEYKAEYTESLILNCSNTGISGHYPNIELVFEAIKSDTDHNKLVTEFYEIELTDDIYAEKLALPTLAGGGLTITGNGHTLILPGLSSLQPKYDLTLHSIILKNINTKTGADVKLSLTAAAGKKIALYDVTSDPFQTISGSSTSGFITDSVTLVNIVSGFDSVSVKTSGTLIILDKVSNVNYVEGEVRFMSDKVTASVIKKTGAARFVLVPVSIDSKGFYTIPKVTVSEISDKLKIAIESIGGDVINIPDSQPILYAGGIETYANNIIVENPTYEHSSNIKAFVYNKEYRAQYANTLHLSCTNPLIEGNYPSFEALFTAIKGDTKYCKSTSETYLITLKSDLVCDKFELPSTVTANIVIDGEGHSLLLPGISSLSFKGNADLKNIELYNINSKGVNVQLSISAQKDLVLDKILSATLIKAISGNAKSTLSMNECQISGANITGFGKAYIKDSLIRTGTTFTIPIVTLDHSELIASRNASITIKSALTGDKGGILLADGFKPISLGGAAEGNIYIAAADGNYIAEGTAVFTTKTADPAVFDVSPIAPPDGVDYALIQNNGKLTFNGYKIRIGAKKFAFWSDAITAIEKGEVSPQGDGTYRIELLANTDIGNKLYFPKNKALEIVSAHYVLTFTSITAPTADLIIKDTDLCCLNSKGNPIAYKISGANNYQLVLSGTDLALCSAITGAKTRVSLNDVDFTTMMITADDLILSGTIDGIISGLTVNTLDAGTEVALDLLYKKSFKINDCVPKGSYPIVITLVDADGTEVWLPSGTTVVFQTYKNVFWNNMVVTNNYGLLYLQKDGTRLIIKL